MTVCPVCAHQQLQGLECEVCGKQLRPARAVDVPVGALPELERTSFAAVAAPAAAPLAELEPTRFVSGPELPAVRVVDVELTAFSPVGEVPVAALGELERGRFLDDGVRTELPLTQVCRYCKNPQAQGSTCDRCGMLLPGHAFVEGAATAGTDGEGRTVKCLQCGSRVEVGQVCGGCGVIA